MHPPFGLLALEEERGFMNLGSYLSISIVAIWGVLYNLDIF
jgi:hypothetical protein